MKKRWPLFVLKFLAFAVVGVALFGLAVMWLWNALIPVLFNGPAIGFWQAAGLLVLSHILLRGWSPCRSSHAWRHDRWRHKFEEKFASLSPEEREKLKEEWRNRCSPFSREHGDEHDG
jgi:hypothetical protein